MKRRKFFQWLGLGAVAVVVPKVVESAPVENAPETFMEFIKANFEKKDRTIYAIEEVGMRPLIATVTKSPVYIDGAYEIGLAGGPRVHFDLLIQSKYTNTGWISSFRIMSEKADGIYIITGYENECRLSEIPVGTKIHMCGTSLSEQCIGTLKPTGLIFTDKIK